MKKVKKTEFTEIDDIKSDLESLKSNVIELTKHLKEAGKKDVKNLKNEAVEKLEVVKTKSEEQIDAIKENVQNNPMQAVGIAFVTGLFASVLLGRR